MKTTRKPKDTKTVPSAPLKRLCGGDSDNRAPRYFLHHFTPAHHANTTPPTMQKWIPLETAI